eukprot:17884-Heterococcus_DN1.PRE.2
MNVMFVAAICAYIRHCHNSTVCSYTAVPAAVQERGFVSTNVTEDIHIAADSSGSSSSVLLMCTVASLEYAKTTLTRLENSIVHNRKQIE